MRFVRVVGGHARSGRLVADHGADVQDPSPTARLHSRNSEPRKRCEGDDIELQHSFKRIRILIFDVAIQAGSRVVDQDVDRDFSPGKLGPQLSAGVRLGQIP